MMWAKIARIVWGYGVGNMSYMMWGKQHVQCGYADVYGVGYMMWGYDVGNSARMMWGKKDV